MLVFLFLFFSALIAQDCNFRARGNLVDHKTFVSCLFGVPFNRPIAQRTLDTLTKAIPLYAFIDALKDSPVEGFQNFDIDILEDLSDISKTNYDVDADFQQDISNIFLQLKDPHTLYTKPRECYSVFAIQPLSFGSRLSSRTGKQVIYINGVYSIIARDPMYQNIPFQDLLGAEVTYIDEQPALAEIKEFARDFMYISKDNGTMFNSALHGGYQQRPLILMPTPLGPFQHLEVAYPNGTFGSFHLPWGFFFTKNTNYTRNGCINYGEPHANSKTSFEKPKPSTFLNEFHVPELLVKETQINKNFRDSKTLEKTLLKAKQAAPSISIFNVSSDIIGLQITTFSPDNNDQFLSVVEAATAQAQANSIPFLIIDVRGNGGGDICLGYQVIERLVAEPNPIGHYDIIQNPLMDLFVSKATVNTPIVGPSSWTQSNGQPYTDNTWYTPGVTHLRGGVNGTYSNPSYLSCDFNSPAPNHQFKKVIILSDGLCGSTCAVFTSHLSEIDRFDTATIGGVNKQQQQAFSFPGGEVLDYNNIVRLAQSMGLSDNLVPRQFPNSAGLRFAWLEIYPWKESDPSNVPLEFIFFPSDYRIPSWTDGSGSPAEQQALYQQVAKLFYQSESK